MSQLKNLHLYLFHCAAQATLFPWFPSASLLEIQGDKQERRLGTRLLHKVALSGVCG